MCYNDRNVKTDTFKFPNLNARGENMSSSNNYEVISKAKPHTIKKFELIESYVEGWMHKLLNYDKCKTLIYIDCMCNSGEYYDESGNSIFGTAVRVAKLLHDASYQYKDKKIVIFLNDINSEKIEHLKTLLPKERDSFKLSVSCRDGNELLRSLGPKLMRTKDIHTLLVYDPYSASIEWDAVMPFLNTWGEVILNHMVSDSIRAIPVAKKPEIIKKYEETYQTSFENLLPYGSNKAAYEKRIEEIIGMLRKRENRYFYIAAFPFFTRTNSLVYNLIHYTSNPNGFTLYKKVAWQTFGGRSSLKNTHGIENQLTFDSFSDGEIKTVVDEDCYYIKDIAEYLQRIYAGQNDVPLKSLWSALDEHPVFPADGFKADIKKALKENHGAAVGRSTISFVGKKGIVK